MLILSSQAEKPWPCSTRAAPAAPMSYQEHGQAPSADGKCLQQPGAASGPAAEPATDSQRRSCCSISGWFTACSENPEMSQWGWTAGRIHLVNACTVFHPGEQCGSMDGASEWAAPGQPDWQPLTLEVLLFCHLWHPVLWKCVTGPYARHTCSFLHL